MVSFSSGCALIRSAASRSVSREAVPLPIAISSTWWAAASRASVVDGLRPARRARPAGPAPLQLVRVDRLGGDRLARAVDHRDLDPGAEPRVQAHRGPRPGRRGQQQVAEVGREHRDRLVLGALPQPHPQVNPEVHGDPGPPGPLHRVPQPAVPRTPLVGDVVTPGDLRCVIGRRGRSRAVSRRLTRIHGQVEDLFLLPAHHGQDPVRGQRGERLGELEVVGELGARLLPALADPGHQPAPGPHLLPQLADQVGVLGEPLDQDGPGAVQRGGRVGHAPLRIDVRRGGLLRDRSPGRPAAGRRAAPAPPRGRSAPWSGAWACRAGRCPRAGPWNRRP